MRTSYQIRRVEAGDVPVAMATPQAPASGATSRNTARFVALEGRRIVGMMTLARFGADAAGAHGSRAEIAVLRHLFVDADHRELGCREALLDVAVHWARANECCELWVELPRGSTDLLQFLRSQGFSADGDPPAQDGSMVVVRQTLSALRPRSDAWFSPHRGAWYASSARR